MMNRLLSVVRCVVILLIALFVCAASVVDPSVKINGMNSPVSLGDLKYDSKNSSGESIRQLCAEITGRYHRLGYTAFYIEKVIIRKDGILELYFHESVVSRINISGITGDVSSVAGAIYTAGDVFNEFTLNTRVSETRRKYGIKSISLKISRDTDGGVVIDAMIKKRAVKFGLNLRTDPVYEFIPVISCSYAGDGWDAAASLFGSIGSNEMLSRGGTFNIASKNGDGVPDFSLAVAARDSRDALDHNGDFFYVRRSFSAETGIYLGSGPLKYGIFIAGTYDDLKNYPAEKYGFSFAGGGLDIHYGATHDIAECEDSLDVKLRIYPGHDYISGVNLMNISGDVVFDFWISTGMMFSLYANCRYVSDDERYNRFYVFDGYMPCRKNDFTTSSWKNISAGELYFQVIGRDVYVYPRLLWGSYRLDGRWFNVLAAGTGILIRADSFKFEASYIFDTSGKIADGVFSFSAGCYF